MYLHQEIEIDVLLDYKLKDFFLKNQVFNSTYLFELTNCLQLMCVKNEFYVDFVLKSL